MPKFFVVSDVHGFYDAMKAALDDAGFDPNNEEHWLVSCGDNLDRGRQPNEIINYLMSLPRCVLVRGNHCDLLLQCIDRGYATHNDFSNGTAQTILDLAPHAETIDVTFSVAYHKVKPLIDKMVNYFETKNYIFVHSFIPLNCDDKLPPYYIRNRKYSKMENWREANQLKWEDARWGDPFELADKGLLPDKTLVFGHWHCSKGWAKKEGRSQFDDDARFDPFYGDGFIAIDACTAHTGKVNCIVIEDEFLTTQN